MRTAATAMRFVAFGVLVTVALLGGLFAAGSALADLPARVAVTGVVLWLAVAGGLSLLAVRSTDRAVPVLTGVVASVTVLSAVDAQVDLFRRDTNGPVTVVALLALLVPLAVLGLRRPLAAGILLLVPAAVLLGSALVPPAGAGPAPPVTALIGGPRGVLVVPMVLAGALLSAAGLLTQGRDRSRPAPPGRPARPGSEPPTGDDAPSSPDHHRVDRPGRSSG